MPNEELQNELNLLRREFEDFRHKITRKVDYNTLAKDKITIANQTGGIPFTVLNSTSTSTNFKKIGLFGTVTLWVSNGNTPHTALTGTAGDVCFGADSGKSYYCTGTTNWTAF